MDTKSFQHTDDCYFQRNGTGLGKVKQHIDLTKHDCTKLTDGTLLHPQNVENLVKRVLTHLPS